jgi:hypothetical protein
LVVGLHQSRRLPAASNWLPSSSKPCVISWPMVAPPVPPKLTAGWNVAPKNGGCS